MTHSKHGESGVLITALDDSEHDDGGWNLHGSGKVSVVLFSNALQVWCVAQNRADVTVQEAAVAFNTTPDVIRQAVDNHYWMILDGDVISHEGE